jgi:MFS family permease
VGHALSNLGDRLFRTTLALLAFQLSGQPLHLGLVLMMSSLPVLLSSIPGGLAADRFDKARLLTLVNAARAVTAVAVPLLAIKGALSLPLLMVLSFCMGSLTQFVRPAQRALVPHLVEKEDCLALNAFLGTSEQAIGVLGPALASSLFLLIGKTEVLYLVCATYGVSSLALMLTWGTSKRASVRRNAPLPVREQLRGGWASVRGNALVTRLIVTFAFLNLFVAALFGVVTPLIAKNVLSVGESGLGFLTSAATAGMVAGTLLGPSLRNWPRPALFSTCYFAFALGAVVAGASASLVPVLVGYVLLGGSMAMMNLHFQTVVQEETSPESLGVVFSMFFFVSGALEPLGLLGAGLLAETLPPSSLFFATAAAAALCGAVFFVGLLPIRRLGAAKTLLVRPQSGQE